MSDDARTTEAREATMKPYVVTYRVNAHDDDGVDEQADAATDAADDDVDEADSATTDTEDDHQMTTDNTDDETDSIFQSDAERAAARATVRESWSAPGDGELTADDVDALMEAVADDITDDGTTAAPEEALYLAARQSGWTPPECSHDDPQCACTQSRFGLDVDADVTTNATTADSGPRYLMDGGRSAQQPADADDYPAPGRAAYRARQAEQDGETNRTDRVNYAAIPGRMDRTPDREAEDDLPPAAGRSAFERRQMGLPEVPEEDDEPPAAGRAAYENRRRNAEAKYPLSAQRARERRRERHNARRRRRGADRLSGDDHARGGR